MSKEKLWLKSNLIYTDGACSGNPGPGGWGAILVDPKGEVIELGGGADAVTNNQMELMATIQGLKGIRQWPGATVIFTDSTYVIRGITQWIWGWKKRGWTNAEGQAIQNRELWEDLHHLVLDREKNYGKENLNWQYVRGHTGNPGNERCDTIAVCFTQKKWVSLYRGPLVGYSVAIHDFPPDVPLPEMRPKTEKKVAHSYLSVLGNKIVRHKTWASCEKRVKGQSGAKFKKSESAEQEFEILKSWGQASAHIENATDE